MYCDFSSVTELIYKQLAKSTIRSHTGFLNLLFSSYIDNIKKNAFTRSEVSKLHNAYRIPTKEWSEYYKNHEREVLLGSIKKIVPDLLDKENIYHALYSLICNDEYITDELKQTITDGFTSDYKNDDTLAELIYEAYMFAVTRPYEQDKQTGKYYAVPFSDKTANAESSNRLLFANTQYIEPCEYFCGRDEELDELHTLIETKSKIIVVGEPGIGKSELVRKYILLFKSDYQHIGYYFYSAEDNRDLLHILSEVNGDNPTADSERELCYKNNYTLLSSLGKKALLVIDSFNVAAHFDKHFLEVLRLKCDVIFTSHSNYDGLCTYEVEPFRSEEYTHRLISSYYGYLREDKETHKYVSSESSPPIDTTIYNFQFADSRMEIAMNYIVLRSDNHPYLADFLGRQLGKGIQTPMDLEYLMQEILERHNGDLMKTQVSMVKDNTVLKGTYTECIDQIYGFSKLSKEEQYALSYMRFIPVSYQAVNKRTYARLIELKDINILETLIEKGYIRETSAGNITLTKTMHDFVDSVIPLDPKEYIAFADRYLSRNNAYLPTKLRYHIANVLTGFYMIYYCKTPFMCLHLRFRYMHRINETRDMILCMRDLASMYRKRECSREEREIYWEDKELFTSCIPKDSISEEDRYYIDHGDGTELPLWKYKYAKRVYEDDD